MVTQYMSLLNFNGGVSNRSNDKMIIIKDEEKQIITTVKEMHRYFGDIARAIQNYRNYDDIYVPMSEAKFKAYGIKFPKLKDYAVKTSAKTNNPTIITNLLNRENTETNRRFGVQKVIRDKTKIYKMQGI